MRYRLRKHIVSGLIALGLAGATAIGCDEESPIECSNEFSITPVEGVAVYKEIINPNESVETLSDGESITAGDLTFKVVQSFASSTAKIEITDSAGNVVKTGINTGSTESLSFGGATYNYRVLSSGATASGVLGYAQLLAGKGEIGNSIMPNLRGHRFASEGPIEIRNGGYKTSTHELYFLVDENNRKITGYREKETNRIAVLPGKIDAHQIISSCLVDKSAK